jgi:hypothetical protein
MIRLVHLVWAPLGPEPLREFLAALDAHPAGRPHRLSVVLNGFGDGDGADAWLALLARRDAQVHRTRAPQQDLGAYAHVAAEVPEPLVCLMNSYARPRREGWLALLDGALERGFAAAGATGSYESHASQLGFGDRWRLGTSARDRLGGVYDWAAYRVRFPRHPNPHLRSNGLLCPRDVLLRAVRRPPADKNAAYVVESGRRGLSARLRRRGELAVVGLDGVPYPPREWPASRTFRSGEQENLLIADNRTREWDAATADERAGMRRKVWGS